MSPYRNFVRIFSLVSLVLIIVLPVNGFALCESDAERVRSTTELAEESLESAYLAVLEAERAGGDISELVTRLNAVLEYLSEVERAFESGEYDSAVLLAERVVEASDLILDDAIGLKGVSELRGEIAFRNQLLISFGIVCFTVLLGFLGWRRFKGYYVRRMMGLRPEVVVDES